jgi:hypothetical protein
MWIKHENDSSEHNENDLQKKNREDKQFQQRWAWSAAGKSLDKFLLSPSGRGTFAIRIAAFCECGDFASQSRKTRINSAAKAHP